MQLLELAFQGVRGFAPSLRVQLKPGYWVLQPSVRGTPPLGGILSALFFSDGRGGDAAFAAAGQPQPNAGVMLQGNDNQTYWLVRNLGQSGALHRYDAATNQFQPVSSEATEIAQFARSQIGAPSKALWDGLFTFSLAQLPTHRPRTQASTAKTAPAAVKPQLASTQPVQAIQDVSAARQKLTELEKERALAEEVEKIQFRYDGVASRVFALETKLQAAEALRSELEQAQAAFQTAPTPESLGLPPDILSRVERYPMLVGKRDEALAKLDAERENESGEGGQGSPRVPPVWTDGKFIASLVAGVVFLVAGAFMSGSLRYIALFDIPAFGIAALLALRYLDDRERDERGRRKGSRSAAREQKIRDQFEAEAGLVQAAMKKLNVDTPTAISEMLSQRPLLHEQLEAARRKLEGMEASPEMQQARQELGSLKTEQAELDGELSAKGAYVRDGREVEREIGRLKEAIALTEGTGSTPPKSAVAAEAPAAEGLPDPMPALLGMAADLFALDLPSTTALVRDRAVQFASAFTDRRVTALDIDTFGKTTTTTSQGKGRVGDLPGSDVNLVYLAVRLAVLEKYGQKFRVPIVVEDIMAGLEPQQLSLVGRVLKGLGKMTQVLHVTDRAEFADLADAQSQV